jgi:hypothetical protein
VFVDRLLLLLVFAFGEFLDHLLIERKNVPATNKKGRLLAGLKSEARKVG